MKITLALMMAALAVAGCSSKPKAGIKIGFSIDEVKRVPAKDHHYLLGPRAEPELVTYYARLKSVFTAIRALLDRESIVVQLVAFSDPVWQLPAYLQTMREAGFREAEADCDAAAKVTGRIWREVPGRKWYANRQGGLPASKEVMLLHRARIVER